MKLAALLLVTTLGLGQSASTPSGPNERSSNDSPEILSDTQGVNFDGYLKGIWQTIRQNWVKLIPADAQFKKGKLAIQFSILKNGEIRSMSLTSSACDLSLDRAAWGALVASNPLPPLPDEFKGQYLRLRTRFYYNLGKVGIGTAPSDSAPAKPCKDTRFPMHFDKQ